jgi:hypothetical protein
VLIVSAVISTAAASRIVQMSFEEAAQAADIVVLGMVADNPELGIEEPASGVVVHTSRVRVDRYLKGTGPPEINVETIGGSFIADKDGRRERMTQVAAGQPQMPAVGSRILLFLTAYGSSGAYMICSASHGVRPIVRRPGSPEDTVDLAFERPDVMTPRAAADYHRVKALAPVAPGELFHDDVPIAELHDLVSRAIAPRPKPQPSAPKRD